MKKIKWLMILCLLMITNVKATTNKLYFIEKDNRLYYDTDSFDETIFMYHDDMIPGRIYVDELSIENNSKTAYELYLKVSNVEQDELADELIDNILMEIYLDNELIYSGTARGLDYQENGVNLQDAISIGKYSPNAESKLVVKTQLSSSYTNSENVAVGKITWEFYGRYEDEVTPILPETSDDITKYVIIFSVASLMFIFLIMTLTNKKKHIKE